MKRCSVSSIITEMQIKPMMRYQFIPTRMTVIKKKKIEKKLKKSKCWGGHGVPRTYTRCWGKVLWLLSKLNIELSDEPVIRHPGIYARKNWKQVFKQKLVQECS